MSTVNRKVTFRLYPTKEQSIHLDHLFELHRQLYNCALEQRILLWKSRRISLTYKVQCREVTQLRRELPEYSDVNAQSMQVTVKRVDLAFRHFFKRVRLKDKQAGFPRFKSSNGFRGWGYKSHGDGWGFEPGHRRSHRIRISGVGLVKVRGKGRNSGIPKTMEVIRRRGKWYASITFKCIPQRACGRMVGGMDWGVQTFLTIARSDGSFERVENTRILEKQLIKLRKAQRELSRKAKFSSNWEKAKNNVLHLHERVSNRRNDFLHKTSCELVKVYKVIGTESLNTKEMTSRKGSWKRGLNRNILDTSPARFLSMLRYKAKEAGATYIEIPTRQLKPTQTCSGCGRVEKKHLSMRIHSCKGCGLILGRDENSALVILKTIIKNRVGDQPCVEEALWLPLKHETPLVTLVQVE